MTIALYIPPFCPSATYENGTIRHGMQGFYHFHTFCIMLVIGDEPLNSTLSQVIQRADNKAHKWKGFFDWAAER